MIPNLVQYGWDVSRLILLFTFCHTQWICNVSVVSNPSIFTHLQVVIVENEVHIVFVSTIASKQTTIEKGCRLVVVHTTSIKVVNVETESQPFVGIDRKIGLETFLAIAVVKTFIVCEIRVRRERVGKGHVFRTQYRLVIWVCKEELAFFSTVKKDT